MAAYDALIRKTGIHQMKLLVHVRSVHCVMKISYLRVIGPMSNLTRPVRPKPGLI